MPSIHSVGALMIEEDRTEAYSQLKPSAAVPHQSFTERCSSCSVQCRGIQLKGRTTYPSNAELVEEVLGLVVRPPPLPASRPIKRLPLTVVWLRPLHLTNTQDIIIQDGTSCCRSFALGAGRRCYGRRGGRGLQWPL